ncbi:MAG: 50S ribosomal protein L4 [Nanoarchaeota archaeon]
MTKIKVYDKTGKEKSEIELPKVFSSPIREDIVAKVLEATKIQQPYGSSFMAGKNTSASGQVIHRRKVWKSQYGRGMSRVPRKISMRRGSQFNWEGAQSPNTRGGRRAHPPIPVSHINVKKINKKEKLLALKSALSASVNKEKVAEKYSRISEKDLERFPIVLESKSLENKSKSLVKVLKNLLGELFSLLKKNKKIRSSKGKLRGRKYKKSPGLLIVISEKDKLKTKTFEIKKVNQLNIQDLAAGGLGRFVIYTDEAIKEIGEKFK